MTRRVTLNRMPGRAETRRLVRRLACGAALISSFCLAVEGSGTTGTSVAATRRPGVPAAQASPSGAPGDLTIRDLWARTRVSLPPLAYRILKDETGPSDTDPKVPLRRITLRFVSLEIEGRRMGHTAVVLMPADAERLRQPDRRGKVVVVGQRLGDDWMIGNYGDPIAARTGYPTMVLPLPGDLDGADGESAWLNWLRPVARQQGDPSKHDFFFSAIPYLRALDILERILGQGPVRAIIGGHSKRAFYAFNAAAMDPDRVAGVVYMGCERLFTDLTEYPSAVNPFHTQAFVTAPVLYLGATNEDGYEMFAINRIQQVMRRPWTIEYIPNHRHAADSEVQYLDWQMWVVHLFDGRPLTTISDLSAEGTKTGTRFRARIASPNRLIHVRAWYVYCDDVPYWRDLMWYPETMRRTGGDVYEAHVEGVLPDAWLVEVKDTAGGFAGYVSSVPQDLTGKPTAERQSRGSRSRLWKPK